MAAPRLDFETARRRRQFEQEAYDSVQPNLFVRQGIIQVKEAGEATQVIDFGFRFIEKPILSCAYDLDETGVTALTVNQFPTLSMGVQKFRYEQVKQGVYHYLGATMIIVTTGHAGMLMNIHFRFEGKALVNPLNPEGGLT